MTRNLFGVCSTIMVGLLCAHGLSSSSHRRADFTYVNPSGIHTLDPARMSWTQDFRVALNIWEGLTTSHPKTTEPIAGAALFPPNVSGDGLTYTFTIHDNARWSNGEAVTAEDFVRGWRRGLEPGTATDYAFLFTDHIAGAAEYVRWRFEAVSTLASLSRLRDGRSIDVEQARKLAERDSFQRLFLESDGAIAETPENNNDDAWAEWTRQLPRAPVDWDALRRLVFVNHVARFDDRFHEVGIRALDNRTLVVRLLRPCPYFPDLTAFPTLLPCHPSIELLRERFEGAPITAEGLVVYDPQWTKPDYRRNGYPGLISNGPYRLADWVFKRRARLTVNPFFREAETIACRSVDMLVYDNVSAAIMAYEAGDVDFLPAMDVPYDHEIARLARSGERPDYHLCPALATLFLNFNCRDDRVGGRPNPLVNPLIRRALSLAVDKYAIVENVLSRGDRIAHTLVPPGAIEGYRSPRGLDRDVERARRLLAEAGYPGGLGLPPVELLYTSSDERVCQALASMWRRELGMTVELRCKESKTFAADKAAQRFMIARGNWYGDYYDPTTFLDCLVTGNGNNDSAYSSTRYDDLMARARATSDASQRAILLAQAERVIIAEDCPILPILHYAVPIAIKPYVGGLFPNARLRFPFRYVTVNR